MTANLPLLRGLGALPNNERLANVVSMMVCSDCDVTWRDIPGAPCWYCGGTGELANPRRLVVD